jgi:predicted glycoside hydrolase/deacetylase ChbG (UPF0249 family)
VQPMSAVGQTNQLLGYPGDACLLIINADDFGMCHAVNKAVRGVLHHGLVRSTSLMAPCPWALHAMRFLTRHPDILKKEGIILLDSRPLWDVLREKLN